MTRGVPHDAELRAEAVAAVRAGAAPGEVARRYGISKGTLGNWLASESIGTVGTTNAHARTREELSALIFDAITATLRSLIARADATGSADWIEKQSAADLAQLAGTEWDRVIRMVAGFRPAEPHELPGPTGSARGTVDDS
jgi:transposase-like protein